MDLIELARTFQADRERDIEASMRRRRLLDAVSRVSTTVRRIPSTASRLQDGQPGAGQPARVRPSAR